jgi:hypothetical protein
MPTGTVDAYAAGVRAMLECPPEIDPDTEAERRRLIRLSEAAHAEWLAFARHIEAAMRPGGEFEHAKDWAGKCPGQAARLAGILHGIEYAHGEPWTVPVAGETMERALAIMAVIARHTLAAYALMGADPGIDAARKVWGWIERGRREAFTARDAFNVLRGTFPKMRPLMDAMEVLEERGYLAITEPETEGPGRRPSPTVRVRPDIAEGWR